MSRWLAGVEVAAVSAEVTPARSHTLTVWVHAHALQPHERGAGWSAAAYLFDVSFARSLWLTGEEHGLLHELRLAFEKALWGAFDKERPGRDGLIEAFAAAKAAGEAALERSHTLRDWQLTCDIVAVTVTGHRLDMGWLGESCVRLLRPDGGWALGARPHTLASDSKVPLPPGLYDNVITRRLLLPNSEPSFATVDLEQVQGVALTSSRWPKVEGPWQTGPLSAVAAAWLQAGLTGNPLHPMGVVLVSPRGR
jgi:hypothetical protein